MSETALNLSPTEMLALYEYLTPEERAEVDAILSEAIWVPQQGPQVAALESEADVLLYGGAPGGGKTDLLLGNAITKHHRSIIFRREAVQLKGIVQRIKEIYGTLDDFNKQDQALECDGVILELGSCKDAGDELKYQGRPHDFIGFDEVTHFLREQVLFLTGWLRTTRKGQRCRVIMVSNPPTGREDDPEWVVEMFAAWLDPNHPNPAEPGELRWYAMVDGDEVERQDGSPFDHEGEEILPQSRTFIPSSMGDNVYINANYKATIQALPEPLRSILLKGDFMGARGSNPWQVIPTEWVQAAQDRWERKAKRGLMDSMGVDVAAGGDDEFVISRRHGPWFDELLTYPGASTPDGPTGAGLVIAARRDNSPVHVDVIGWGSSVHDFLKSDIHSVPVNAAEKSEAKDRSGQMRMVNTRAELWWAFREALDPAHDEGVCLPPDSQLRADLCAPTWKPTQRGIQIESKEDLMKRIKRSPDRGDAVVMAWKATKKKVTRDVYIPKPLKTMGRRKG